MDETISYNADTDTFTMSSQYFAEMMAKLVAAFKRVPAENNETVAAMDSAYLRRFPDGNRLTGNTPHGVRSAQPGAKGPETAAQRETREDARQAYSTRFPNAQRLGGGC